MSSPTRANILRFITTYIERHTYGPTIREIAEGVGCATSNAHRHVSNLAKAGKIVKRWHQARSIRLPTNAVGAGSSRPVSQETSINPEG